MLLKVFIKHIFLNQQEAPELLLSIKILYAITVIVYTQSNYYNTIHLTYYIVYYYWLILTMRKQFPADYIN